MFSFLLPKEGKFFDLFNQHAEQVVMASRELIKLLTVRNESDTEAARHCEVIYGMEKRGDEIERETMQALHRSFITPLDREEIHQLVSGLEETLDLIQDVANTVSLYNVSYIPEEAVVLGKIGLACCEKMQEAVSLLSSMDNASQILKICHEIGSLESDADREMRGAMSKLFREEPDVRELIKFKSVYELLESLTDRCEDVAEVIEGIVLENS